MTTNFSLYYLTLIYFSSSFFFAWQQYDSIEHKGL